MTTGVPTMRIDSSGSPDVRARSATVVKAALLISAVGIVSLLHYLTAAQQSVWHAVYQHLYHLPVIFGAYWFGVKGGLWLAMIAALAYLPHIGGFHDQDSRFALSQYTELLLLFIIGGTVGLLASAQRRLTDRFRQTAESLRAANIELTQSHEEMRRAERLAALGQIAAGLAHELRNPIAAINGAIEIVASRVASGTPEAEFTGLADVELKRLDALLTDFLAYARPREPQFAIAPLSYAVQHVLSLLRPIADRAAVSLTSNCDAGERLVRADREQIEQVLFNTVLNAIQASPRGGAVTIDETEHDGNCVIAVSDEGPGIPPDVAPRIFEPFFTTKTRGTGLGLPTAHRIVVAHGGRIEMGAAESGGTVCRVILPLALTGTTAASAAGQANPVR